MTTSPSRRVWVALGGNLGEREAALRAALRALASGDVAVEAVSSLYETPPWGVADQPPFLNAVVRLQTAVGAHELLRRCKTIEAAAGRDPAAARNSARPIDLDLLLIAGETIEALDLQVPHPQMAVRAFVLVPLAEIDPDVTHGPTGHTAARLAASLDQAGITVWRGPEWWSE